ncbi:MAG TPA: DUF1549 domain-containing protein [Verrucomicrobiales bacterium]|jgi:hypothetical protein|nr:DUF1549 domain-containing protein [Verrucomicrobiales bacterium]
MKTALRYLCVLGILSTAVAFIYNTQLKPRSFLQPTSFSPNQFDAPVFRTVIQQIDQAFHKEWTAAELTPIPRAPDLIIARRLSLALTGTIPSMEEIRALEAQPEKDRIQWWLAHLLEDQRSSDYLAERLARIYVGVEKGPFLVYRRRRMVDWLSNELHRNRPYDELVRNLISAEGIWTSRPEVNFVTVTIDQNNDEEGPDEIKLAARVTRAFLGVRIDCVQCHDDMFGDRWKQKDFHQLAAYFSDAGMSLTGVRDKPTPYEYRYKGKLKPETVPPIVPFQPELLPNTGSLRQRLSMWVTHPENKAFARTTVNRIWALLFNKALIEPIDDIPLEGPYPPGMEILSDLLIREKYDLQQLIRTIAATQVFQRDSRAPLDSPTLTDLHESSMASFPLTRLRPEQVAGSIIQATSLRTINADSHVIKRITRFFSLDEFIKRYGDIGQDEFASTGGTIPQRLVLMNGELVHERTKDNIFVNASSRIRIVSPDDATAIDTAYLTALTRHPSSEEKDYFLNRLKDKKGESASNEMQDLFWAMINSTEFSWNH